MGKPSSQYETTINHFSHPHPLQLCNYQTQQSLFPVICSCCNLRASGLIYTCTQCNYFLDVQCSQMPQSITHPFDQNHVLSLISTQAYPHMTVNCDACGKEVQGLRYRCDPCNFDIHTNCAIMPLLLTHQSHHHQLNLTFSVPYPTRTFNCDVCQTLGNKQWLYRCNLCEFDVHLDCAKEVPMPAPVQAPPQHIQSSYRSVPLTQAPSFQPVQVRHYQASPSPAVPMYQFAGKSVQIGPASAPMNMMPPMVPGPAMQNYNYMNNAAPVGYGANMNTPAGGSCQQRDSMSNQILQGVIDGACQTIGQDLVQGLLGLGGGGGGSSGFNF